MNAIVGLSEVGSWSIDKRGALSRERIHIGALVFLLLRTDYRLLADLKCVAEF